MKENGRTKVNFKTWLLKQYKRDDPIGDLARDVKKNPLPRGCTSWTKIYRFITQKHNPCDGAIKALHKAKREYEKLGKSNCAESNSTPWESKGQRITIDTSHTYEIRALRILRVMHDIPLKILAESIGMSIPHLSRIERGIHKNISPTSVKQLQNIFGQEWTKEKLLQPVQIIFPTEKNR